MPDFSDTGMSDVVDGPGLDRVSPVLRQLLSKFDNFGQADLYFCVTFDKMEHEALEWMKIIYPGITTIGPMVSSAYLDNRMEDNTDCGFNMNKADASALEWLNTKEPNWVVYVACGSMIDKTLEESKEIAMALKSLGCNFLWVMKEIDEIQKLPSNLIEEMSEKGMFVKWCSQLQVLSHPAVGYMVTHCGANSLMEAIVFEVPMVGIPRFADQITNAYYAEEVWKVGVKVKKNEEGVY